MRRLLALALALVALPAAAQDQPEPEWAGVWEGRIATYPVRLCVYTYGDGRARGSYYYLSQLEPIQLGDEEGKGGWIERAGEREAQWQFSELSAIHLRGTWSQGTRRLRFDLRPVAWTESEWGGPCSSAAFVEPLLAGGRVVEEPAAFEGWPYTEHSYLPPAHLTDEVAITTFTFTDTQPGDPAINAVLRAVLPQGTATDDLLGCMVGAVSALGLDGSFERSLVPALVTDAFLVVDDSNGNFCGGAHPNYWQALRTFDRQSGAEIDLFDWIGAPRVEGELPTLAAPLRALVMARWPADADPECREYVADADYWTLGLARDGVVFQPDLPHVATPCEERITVEWNALAPFLDAEGKAGLARLRS